MPDRSLAGFPHNMDARPLARGREICGYSRLRLVETATEKYIIHATGFTAGGAGRCRGACRGHRICCSRALRLGAHTDLAMHAFGPQRLCDLGIVTQNLGRRLSVAEIVQRSRKETQVAALVGDGTGNGDTNAAAGAADAVTAETGFYSGRSQAGCNQSRCVAAATDVEIAGRGTGRCRTGAARRGSCRGVEATISVAVSVAVSITDAGIAIRVVVAVEYLGVSACHDQQ